MDLQVHGENVLELRMFLATHLSADQLNRVDSKELLLNRKNDVLIVRELRQVSSLLGEMRALEPSTPTLVSLLRQGRGVEVCIKAAEQRENERDNQMRDKNLIDRRRKLLRLDEEMRYSSMVRNVKTQSVDNEIARHQTSVRQHLSIGANMVMARITAFIGIYFVARNVTENETARVVAGLGGAIVMMVIEMVLFITRAAKFEHIELENKKHQSVF